jgi:hypothetical protein
MDIAKALAIYAAARGSTVLEAGVERTDEFETLHTALSTLTGDNSRTQSPAGINAVTKTKSASTGMLIPIY